MSTRALSRREADVLACLLDTVIRPAGSQPPPAATDAVEAFDRSLASAPALNRAGLRGLLWALELGSLAGPGRRRMRRLGAARRQAHLESALAGPAGPAVGALVALVKLSYYGDDSVMASLGYDAAAVVARGRAVRMAEARW